MRLRVLVVICASLCALAGCSTSRKIVNLPPLSQPPLQELDRHLTYTNPYDGRPDYVVHRQ